MNSKMVSIILTCYNQEKYIEDTILSVIKQKYSDWELLIGDDSPGDNCRNIISKYTKKYPSKIYAWHHNPNKGIVNNMQFLLEQRNKKSEYVAFLEGDDCLFPEYLEKKIEVFTKHHNVQLIYNELSTIDEKSNIIIEKNLTHRIKSFCKKGKIAYEKLIGQIYYMSRSTLMVRSEVFDKYQITPSFLGSRTIISDVYFFNQVAHNEDIYGIEEPLTYYRIQSNSVTKNTYGSIMFYLEIINYINYLFEQGFIKVNVYNNQTCKYYLIVSFLSIKKSLSLGMLRSISAVCAECARGLKILFNRWIK